MSDLQSILDSHKVETHYKHRGGKTFKGHDVDAIKSALQKSIRLGKTQDAIEYAVELWLFVTEKESPSGSDGVVTNLINRLHVIASEDIGVANPFLPCLLKEKFALLDKPKGHKGVMTSRKSVSALRALLEICHSLSTSAHSRLMSLIITPYFKIKHQERLMSQFPDLYDRASMGTAHQEGFLQAIQLDSTMSAYHAGHIEADIESSISKEQLPRVVGCSQSALKRYTSACWVWEELLRLSPNRLVADTVTELFNLYQRLPSERRLYLVHAIVLVQKTLHDEQGNLEPAALLDIFDEGRALDTLTQYLRRPAQPIPEAYLDMHTSQGRAKGLRMNSAKGLTHFIESGTRVSNEIQMAFGTATFDRLQECYVWAKMNLDSAAPAQKLKSTTEIIVNRVVADRIPQCLQPVEIDSLPTDWPDLLHFDDILDGIQTCKKVTCGGKPPTLRSRIRGKGDVFWIFKEASDGGCAQLLTDRLKPMCGLNSMVAERFKADFQLRRTGRDDGYDQYECVMCDPAITYLVWRQAEGEVLSTVSGWKSDADIMQEYLTIGAFRYGTVRASDFNSTNVIRLTHPTSLGNLLSIDEMQIGVRRGVIQGTNDKQVREHFKKSLSHLIALADRWAKLLLNDIKDVVQNCGFHPDMAAWIADNLKSLKADMSREAAQIL